MNFLAGAHLDAACAATRYARWYKYRKQRGRRATRLFPQSRGRQRLGACPKTRRSCLQRELARPGRLVKSFGEHPSKGSGIRDAGKCRRYSDAAEATAGFAQRGEAGEAQAGCMRRRE